MVAYLDQAVIKSSRNGDSDSLGLALGLALLPLARVAEACGIHNGSLYCILFTSLRPIHPHMTYPFRARPLVSLSEWPALGRRWPGTASHRLARSQPPVVPRASAL